jgi:hypothetical protein
MMDFKFLPEADRRITSIVSAPFLPHPISLIRSDLFFD